jgi:hypothetical protein
LDDVERRRVVAYSQKEWTSWLQLSDEEYDDLGPYDAAATRLADEAVEYRASGGIVLNSLQAIEQYINLRA